MIQGDYYQVDFFQQPKSTFSNSQKVTISLHSFEKHVITSTYSYVGLLIIFFWDLLKHS